MLAKPASGIAYGFKPLHLVTAVLRLLLERDPTISIVNLSRNFGKEVALIAGLDHSCGDAADSESQCQIPGEVSSPSVLRGEVADWFELGTDSPYMLVITNVFDAPGDG